jgi:hypothetical protein
MRILPNIPVNVRATLFPGGYLKTAFYRRYDKMNTDGLSNRRIAAVLPNERYAGRIEEITGNKSFAPPDLSRPFQRVQFPRLLFPPERHEIEEFFKVFRSPPMPMI